MKHEKSCGCIIIEDKKVLLIKQTNGIWGFPKGHVEEGETLKQTAVREVAEETKRIAFIIDEYEPFVEKYTTPNGEECACYMFFAVDKGKSNNQSEDTHDVVWTPVDKVLEVLSYDSLKNTWKSVEKIILEILEKDNV